MSELTGTKLRIVDCAIELFAQSGYGKVSIRDIARMVGIKDASIYSHFVSKDEILDTLFNEMRQEILSELPRETDLDAIFEKSTANLFLERGFQLFKKRISDPRQARIYLILIREQYDGGRGTALWREHLEYSLVFLENAFRKMIDKGWLKPRNPKQLAISYGYTNLILLNEYIRQHHWGQDTKQVEKQIRQHRELFLDMASN